MQQSDFQVFAAADGAYAAFEEAVLSARSCIIGGFRIFDMRTRLVSDAARAVGETWFDLLAHVVRRGVTLRLIISDFDPVYATALHRATWATVKQAVALREVTGASAKQLDVRPALHPASPGLVPWLAFLPVSLRRAWKARDKLTRDQQTEAPRLGYGLPRLSPVSHHQKLAVIDDDTLYIGGLDLNDRRFDTPDHARAAKETWSDVQVLLRNDPAVAEAKEHLDSFEAAVHRKSKPPGMTHLRRTLSADRRIKLPFLSPMTILSEIEEAHLSAFKAARDLIYIETQFMRAPNIAEALAKAAQARTELGLIMVLPALPEDVAFGSSDHGIDIRYGLELERDALSVIREGFGARAVIACPVRPVMAARPSRATRAGSPIIYVHNKVLVQDNDFALVGSGNLNGRSLRWDTEAALAIRDPRRIEILQRALAGHWWWNDLQHGWTDPARMQSRWRDGILRNDVHRPETREGFLVSHDASVHEAEGQPLPLATTDMV